MKTAGFTSFFFSGDNTAFAAERAVLEHLRIHAAQNPIATWIVIACLFLMILLFVVLFFMIRLQIRMRKNFIENQATVELLDHILKQTGFDFFQISLDNRRLDVLKRHNIVWQYDKSGVALPPERCVLPEDAPHFREQWDALKSGKVAAIQLDYGMLAGEAVRHFFLYGEKKYSKVFKQDIIVGYVRETTTDKQKERRLSELDAFTQAILSVSPCIMWVKDPANEFRIAETNHAFEKFLKLPKDKLLGHGEWEFFTQSEYVRIHQQDLQSLNRDGISECVDSGRTQKVTRESAAFTA